MNPADGPTLRDIHLPAPPGWWPPAPGWWLLGGICICIVIFAVVRVCRARARRRARDAVLRELDRCIETARGDPVALAAALSHFLRRMALRDAPGSAAYEGERWLEYLDTRGATDEFRNGIGRVIADAPYRPATEYDTAALIALVRRWTRGALATGARHA